MLSKRLFIWIGISQLLIFITCFSVYRNISLLAYTNVSFIVGIALVLVSLFGFVVKGGFFDIVFHSFQNVFGKMEDKERSPLSKLFPQHYYCPLLTGVITLIAMFVTLSMYY